MAGKVKLTEDARTALTQLRQKTVLSGCTSYVQRKMNIGFVTAARLMDELESAGEISAPDSDGKRHWPAGRAHLASRKDD